MQPSCVTARERHGVPAQTNQNTFRCRRAAFYSTVTSGGNWGLIFAKDAALRININTDGSPVAMGRTHITHGSHAPHLSSSSSLFHHLLGPSPLPYFRAKGGISRLQRHPVCSALFLLPSCALRSRLSTLTSCIKQPIPRLRLDSP